MNNGAIRVSLPSICSACGAIGIRDGSSAAKISEIKSAVVLNDLLACFIHDRSRRMPRITVWPVFLRNRTAARTTSGVCSSARGGDEHLGPKNPLAFRGM